MAAEAPSERSHGLASIVKLDSTEGAMVSAHAVQLVNGHEEVLDTGANQHMCTDQDKFMRYVPLKIPT